MSRMSRARAATFTAAVLLASPGIARDLAAQTTHFGQTQQAAAAARAAFTASLGAVATNTLTGLNGTTIPFGALGTAAVTNGVLGSGSIFVPAPSQAEPLILSFSGLLNGFGATFSDVGSCCGNAPFPLAALQLAFFNGATSVGTITQQFATSGELRAAPAFFGVTGLAAFDRVEVRGNTGDFYNVDDPTVGTAPATPPPPGAVVPEPSTWVLLAGGLATLAGAARRRALHA